MAVTPWSYQKAAGHFTTAGINWGSDTISAALLTDAYTINNATHEFVTDLTNELSGGSYTRKTLASKTSVLSGGILTLSAANISWTTITAVNIRWIVFFKNTGSDATSTLICANDLGTNYSPTAQNFDYTISASGIVNFVM